MNDNLELFQQFGKRHEAKENKVKEVWLYTRVSTKDQKENYSLENQKKAAELFAQEHGFIITRTFGQTNESGRNDFTRKEFIRLLTEVKKARIKPFAIIIYKMNRFSRSGGKSIALATELVDEIGVHLIEIVSEIDTTTPKGRNELNKRLLQAEEENINKLEHTVPGMKSFIRAGNRLGMAPLGYTHTGKKVKDPERFSFKQKIWVNETGEKLRLAWQWKVEGVPDHQIIKRLEDLGVNISKQKLSAMWRNVFYCGLISNSLLEGDVLVGNHEPMVSREVFLKVQEILKTNNQGYTVVKKAEERPLTGTLRCKYCGQKLTGYEVKAKGLHYYKCNVCKGVSINAQTSRRFKKKTGAHELFVELLDSYKLDKKYLDLFEKQMKKMFYSLENKNSSDEAVYKKRMSELENNKKNLEKNYAFGKIEEEKYRSFLDEINDQIRELMSKYDFQEEDVSNLKKYLKETIDFTQNVSKYWVSGSVDHKQRIQKLVFPEGLVIDTEKRQF
ncbi:MAG: recombinase family protein [Bacteroidales bacterium]|nr:recombinase family protein [Bacteroidales bacterium]